MWTIYQILDVERIEGLVSRDDLFKQAELITAAVLDAKAYNAQRGEFMGVLRRDPDAVLIHSAEDMAAHLKRLDEFAEENAKKFPLVS